MAKITAHALLYLRFTVKRACTIVISRWSFNLHQSPVLLQYLATDKQHGGQVSR